IMTHELLKSVYITMRVYVEVVKTSSITWSEKDIIRAIQWSFYCYQGNEILSRKAYYYDFISQCEKIRQHISSTIIPNDFIQNVLGYLLNNQKTSYETLLDYLRSTLTSTSSISTSSHCLFEALVSITVKLPAHLEFIFDLLYDMSAHDELCLRIVDSIFKQDISGSYTCLVSMKLEKLITTFEQASYGAYIILKLILKNRQSFKQVNIIKQFKYLSRSNY
ncbi:unnamed protein product, partial [Didymodactylos carnosus]